MIDISSEGIALPHLLPALVLLTVGALLSVIPEILRSLLSARRDRQAQAARSREHIRAELLATLKMSDVLHQQIYFRAVVEGDWVTADRTRADALVMAEAVDAGFASSGGEAVAFVGASAKLRFFYAKRLIVAIRLLMREFKARGEDRSESARADAARILRLMDEARAEIAQL